MSDWSSFSHDCVLSEFHLVLHSTASLKAPFELLGGMIGYKSKSSVHPVLYTHAVQHALYVLVYCSAIYGSDATCHNYIDRGLDCFDLPTHWATTIIIL